MAKVFRIHNTGTSLEDWFPSQRIGKNVIEHITSQDSKGTKQPTSIPSPFARIDLVRTAFKKVASPDANGLISLDGDTDAHKLVSDALDIGQLFFNLDRHQSALQVTRWNKADQLNQLLDSADERQRHLGRTMQLFLEQDNVQYNFNLMDDLYILKYNHHVIGGTSPRTLFFAASRADKLKVDIKFGDDEMLDQAILPLFKREKSYVKYVFALANFYNSTNTSFASLFPEVTRYISENKEELRSFDPILFEEISNYDRSTFSGLDDQFMPGLDGVPIEVIRGMRLKKAPEQKVESDFEIKATKKVVGKMPLVLPTEVFTDQWKYVDSFWQSGTEVLKKDNRPINERTLPDQGHKHPYLTEADFLAPKIIRLPYEIDSDKFFTAGSGNFLLPLTRTFFEYFRAEDLGNKVSIEIDERQEYGGITNVTLKIPTKKGIITYRKKYKATDSAMAESGDFIYDISVGLSIYPFVRSANVSIDYNIGLVNISARNSNFLISPIDSTDNDLRTQFNEPINKTTRSNTKSDFTLITEHYAFKRDFDALELEVDSIVAGYILPKIPSHSNGAAEYSFAIDFGTTNTHIEYKTSSIRGFDIVDKETQNVFLRKQGGQAETAAIKQLSIGEAYLIQESVPVEISSTSQYNFPIRTSIVENQNINHATNVILFNDLNIAFDFEIKRIQSHLHLVTDLKWSNLKEVTNETRVLKLLEQLLKLCKNKVLLNNGKFDRTKITWFYPISMIGAQLNRLRDLWSNAFLNVFGESLAEENLLEASESIAPFYYYQKNEGIMTQVAPAISIDIGGGTSDVVVFERGIPTLITSFQYAGNSIFGDGLNKNPAMNGFVKSYKDQFASLLADNELMDQQLVLKQILDDIDNSETFVNFLFSLSGNAAVRNTNSSISFENRLKANDNMRIVFLHFYASLFYHIAQLMHSAGIAKPTAILFSGTGSKTSVLLNQNATRWEPTENLVNAIFNYVYDSTDARVKITVNKNPKELTAKGGLAIDSSISNLDQVVKTHLGGKGNLKLNEIYNHEQKSLIYKDLTDIDIKDVMHNLEDYIEMMSKINSRISFKNVFGITTLGFESYAECIGDLHQLEDYLRLGLDKQKVIAGSDSEPIEETLFFYPFIGLLNDLAFKISNS